MVIDVGAAIAGDLDAVSADIVAVRAAVPDSVLKVIVESAALLSLAGEQTLIDVCRVAADAGAELRQDVHRDFIPSGGASVRAVEIMAATVGPDGRSQGERRHPNRGRRRGDAGCRRDQAGAVGYARGARRALKPREAGIAAADRNGRVLRGELADHAAVGDLDAVGVDAKWIVLGQLRAERVKRGLDRFARQREAQAGQLLYLQRDAVVHHLPAWSRCCQAGPRVRSCRWTGWWSLR